jgi:hypothetical protein
VSPLPATGPSGRKGEDLIVPADLFDVNLVNGRASSSRRGIDWIARQVIGSPCGIIPTDGKFKVDLQSLIREAEVVLSESALLSGLDLNSDAGAEAAMKVAFENESEPIFSAFLLATKASYVVEQLGNQNDKGTLEGLAGAAWSAGVLNALFRFKQFFEDACYQGNSIGHLRSLLDEWERNQLNSSEAFWQDLFLTHPFALSQLFSVPVVIHGEQYFVGGSRAGGKHGKFVDYLLRNRLTDAAMIVELKTPCTLLLGPEYRTDVFAPSAELSGSIQQVLEQRSQFMKNMPSLQSELEEHVPKLEMVEPHTVVIIGDATRQLNTKARRRSFEQFRAELRNVRLVTFDELFDKLKALIDLLGASTPDSVGK